MPMTTKPFYAFKMRIDKFDDDIEFIDVLRDSVKNGDLSPQGGNLVFSRVQEDRHTHLARRNNSDHSRKLVVNHLRKSVYSSYVKDIYEELTVPSLMIT